LVSVSWFGFISALKPAGMLIHHAPQFADRKRRAPTSAMTFHPVVHTRNAQSVEGHFSISNNSHSNLHHRYTREPPLVKSEATRIFDQGASHFFDNSQLDWAFAACMST
jgi:hypothetical protein